MTTHAQRISPEPGVFEGMAELMLDAGLFTSQFGFCDTIAEYLSAIVAQSHDDPARYANFSSLLVNELVELAFRAAQPTGKVDITLLRSDACIRICVGFIHDKTSADSWLVFDRSAAPGRQHPAYDLIALARAVAVNLYAETDGDDRVVLIADFVQREGVC